MLIKIGTRKSKLAMWQAEHVAEQLQKAGVETELVTMETRGDKVLDVAISKIGSKGVFTEELEEKLRKGEVDIAVHSAKDMPSRLEEGLEIIAFTKREQVNDVVIADSPIDMTSEELVLGTSSTRRVAMFRRFLPNVRLVDVRGNLQTRIAKMREGLCDGLVLAYAGIHRLGHSDLIQHTFGTETFTPAVGQGSLAIESYQSLDSEKREVIIKALNDETTSLALKAERAFLATMDGGCSIPVFALASYEKEEIALTAGIISLDGQEIIRKTAKGVDPEISGKTLAEEVLTAGGDRILKAIKDSL